MPKSMACIGGSKTVTARIFTKLIAAMMLIMVVALGTIDFLASRMVEKAYVDTLTRELTGKALMMDVMGGRKMADVAGADMKALASAAGGRITLIRRDGTVVNDSEADPARMENHSHRAEIVEALQGRTGVSIRRSPTLGTDFLYVAVPVGEGALRLARPLDRVHEQIAGIRLKLVLYTGLALLPAILLAALFARSVSAKMGAIIDFASTLATGDFKARMPAGGKDELGILSRQLNETGQKLQAMFEALEREHAEMEKVERVRKDFVINVSHELRTPLASIQGYTETLLDGAINDQDNNIRFLNIIRQNAERLGRLTADLLTISRVELKTQRFQFASYYVKDLLEDCVDSLRPVAAKKKIELRLEADDEKSEAFCDSEAVHQIMSNLIDNAIKYTPEGGAVRVLAKRLDKGVEVRVADSGMGIPPEELPRLFERFYRVDKARSRELGGTGLGLAIVKHLVKAQAGDVWVESELGKGSTFAFTLPREDPQSGCPAAAIQAEFTES
jgi:two-component system phosphate regulon sensor histidine kinase PhoR